MVNFNGEFIENEALFATSNRGFLYGDSVFETIKVYQNKVLFLEEHYFRLMATMRIVRMKIPNDFTMEYFEKQILGLVNQLKISDSARVRFSVYRVDGGLYLPHSNQVSYVVEASKMEFYLYKIHKDAYEVELFKDFFVAKNLLSTIKTSNRMLQVTGSIFAKENDLDNALLLNNEKNVIEALNGSIFIFKENKLITPPVSDGCINGIMRKQILKLAESMPNIEVEECSISPFDLQKCDEIFITNIIVGIQPVTKYRKKYFDNKLSLQLLDLLNAQIESNLK